MIGNTEGFLIGGTVDSIVFFSTIFRNATTGGTLIKLEPNTVITRRFRFAFAPMIVPVGSVGIDIPLTVTMPTDSYQVSYAAFSGGGNYTAGIDSQDNRADFSQNSGIANTRYTLDAGFEDNAVATAVGAGNQGVYLPIGGVSVLNSLSGKFVQIGDNSYEYTGAVNQSFLVSCNATFTSSANNQVAFKIAKNGIALGTRGRGTANAANRAENVFTQVVVELQQGDLIQVFGANLTNTGNFTVVDLSFIAILS